MIEFLGLLLLIALVAIPVTLFVKFLKKLESSHFAQEIFRIRKEEPSRWKVIRFVSLITSFGLMCLAFSLIGWWYGFVFLGFVFSIVWATLLRIG